MTPEIPGATVPAPEDLSRAAAPPPRPDGAAAPAAAVYIGLGANLGDPVATLEAALDALAALARPGRHEEGALRVSSFWRTAPIEAHGPDFVNAVAGLSTDLAPHALLDVLQSIEARFGRERPYRNAPRTLDLDLLVYGVDGDDGGRVCTDERLTLPHPRAHERAFVLEPLAELWPSGRIPHRGEVLALRDQLRAQGGQRVDRLPH